MPKKIPNLSFVYYAISLIAHLLSFQFFLVSLLLFVLSVTIWAPSSWLAVLSGLATALFTLNIWQSYRASAVLERILPGKDREWKAHFIKGGLFPLNFGRKNVNRIQNLPYGPDEKKNLLDIYTPADRPQKGMPILIHVHGGAWVVGKRNEQAKGLIYHMAKKGWMVVDISYRLGPKNRFPAMITDVLKAIAWVKANAAQHGGDPSFVALTGGSAGGHLTALAALAADHTGFKPGFEDADCRVNAAIPLYGVYDFVDRTGALANGQAEFETFMAKYAMPAERKSQPDFWDSVSPMSHIRPDAPPMLIIHGKNDTLADFKGGQIFANAMRETSANTVIFAALPGTQHAFDVVISPPTPSHIRATERFLEMVRAM